MADLCEGGNESSGSLKPICNYDTYILIIHHRDTTNIIKDVRAQIAKLKQYSEWNPRAMFIVLLTEALTHQEQIAEALLSEFWKSSYIINAIVLSSTLSVILEDGLNTDGGRPGVNVYTFYPYSPPGNCGNITKAFLIDQWFVDNNSNGRFLRNSILFPNKIPHDFHGCPITVSGFVHPPFIIEIKNSSKDGDQLIYENGIGVQLIEVLAKRVNMSVRYRKPPPPNEMWGYPLENGSWTGVRGEVLSKKSDTTIAGTWDASHIVRELESSATFFMDGFKWYVPCARPYPLWLSIIRAFRYEVWITIFVSLLLVSIFTLYLLKIRSIILCQNVECNSYNTYASCLLNMWAHILGASSASAPNCIPVRGFFLFWLWYCWFINAVYQTFLVGYFADPGLLHQISSEEELINSDVELGIISAFTDLFPELGKSPYERRNYCEDFETCLSRIAFEKDVAVLNSFVDMQYLTAKYMDGYGKPTICQTQEVYAYQHTVLPMAKGHPMLYHFNDLVFLVTESGLVDQWWNEFKYKTVLSVADDFQLPQGDYVTFSLEHLQSVFSRVLEVCLENGEVAMDGPTGVPMNGLHFKMDHSWKPILFRKQSKARLLVLSHVLRNHRGKYDSVTESYPAFARIGLRENPEKNLNQITCPDRDSNPDHLVSRPDALTITPQFKMCHGSLYAVMWLADEPREFNLPTLPQRCITCEAEKLPSKYGVHSEDYNTYVLISHNRDTTNIIKDVRTQIAKLKEYSEWNPRAMFIVLLTEALTHQEKIAEALLSELWRSSYISNSIVLSPTVDAILKGDLNTAHVKPRVNLYTSFPYSPPGNCGNTPKTFLINQWVVDNNGNGRFLGNAMLFPNKIPNDFHGCPIRVSGFDHPPFVGEIKNSSEGGDQLIYENGIGVRIIDVFAKHLNMSIRYMPPNAEMWGHPQENGSWTGVRGLLHQISSEEELISSDVELGIREWSINLFPELGKLPHERRNYCEDLDVCMSRIAFEKDVSVISSLVDMTYQTLKYMDGIEELDVCFVRALQARLESLGFSERARCEARLAQIQTTREVVSGFYDCEVRRPRNYRSHSLSLVLSRFVRSGPRISHVACVGSEKPRLKIGRQEGKIPLGRPRRRLEDNIKMDLREVGYDGRNWINLAQDRDRRRSYVRAAMNIRDP
ncbi:hypothetical protein ANN_05512 [Periplaneta americana]|uniref:Uncharacterized protein n=1 Tax=Periplaneta americana TaxID=6978 RepID=A0ABQ8TCU8_PERAM|nr:hypothetical protein ANN_05512 [Periplaneta americana]